MYDLIGDIHGHASELVKLLAALGYSKHKGVYKHHQRQAIFLGDFIVIVIFIIVKAAVAL